MFMAILRISVTLFIISFLAYSLIVIKEKYFLKQNMIVLDSKHLRQEDINETDINEFVFQGIETRSGDEVRVVTDSKEYEGMLIGLKFDEESIHILTYRNEIEKIKLGKIKDFSMLNKYGSFF